MITLSGLVPGEDIEIKFTGIRPGEKLFEELATDDEHADKNKHPKIFVGRFRPSDTESVKASFDDLHALSDDADREAIKQAFSRLVPEYNGAGVRERKTPTPKMVPEKHLVN